MGRFLCDDFKPKPRDNSNIMTAKTEANEIKLKLQAVKDKIAEHDDSLFPVSTGKLKIGLSCYPAILTVTKAMRLSLALKRMLITLLKIWTGQSICQILGYL